MSMTLAERIIGGEEVSVGEIRGSDESVVVNALQVKDDSGIPPDYLAGKASKVYEKIKDLNLHGSRCPCWNCQSQLKNFHWIKRRCQTDCYQDNSV